MPWVEVNGIDIRYIKEGSGPSLVFLHGNSSCSVAWERQFEEFAKDFRCIAYDSVNHGFSGNSARGAEEPDRADELEGLLAALGIEQPILVGNSMGGNTALRWAVRHPDGAKGLVISGAGVRSGAESAPPERPPMDHETLYVPVGASFTVEFKERQPVQHERYFRIRSTATRLEALRHPRKPSAKTVEERAALINGVQAIQSPIQIITGDLDFALDAARKLHEVRPDARYEEMEGAPHNAYFEMPERWNPVARAFLETLG